MPARGRRAWRDWMRTAAAVIAGFAGAELANVAVLFLWLPAPVAADVAWPAYMLRAFDEVLPQRWPRWEGWRVLVGQYLTVVSAVALAVAGMALSARRERASNAGDAALFLPAILFVFGCLQSRILERAWSDRGCASFTCGLSEPVVRRA